MLIEFISSESDTYGEVYDNVSGIVVRRMMCRIEEYVCVDAMYSVVSNMESRCRGPILIELGLRISHR